MIQVFSNSLDVIEAQAMMKVLYSKWLGRGERCREFEQAWDRHIIQEGSLLFNCCTAASKVALQALGVGRGDEVILPTCHFVGVANAVIEVGAFPRFADVDPMTMHILPSEIDRLRNQYTKAVFMLHYGGHAASMEDIMAASEGLLVLEDAANGPCTAVDGKAIGTFGDAGVWSFDAMKVLVMGDGGMLWLRDEEAQKRAEALRYMGLAPKSKSGIDSSAERDRWWEFDLVECSGRYTSNDVLAAAALMQMTRLPATVQRRRDIWRAYQTELRDVPEITRPPEPLPGSTMTGYLYWIQCDDRDLLARYLLDNGVYTTFRYWPLHLVPYYRDMGLCPEALPNAERAAERTLCLPIHQNLTAADVDKVISLVREFYRR